MIPTPHLTSNSFATEQAMARQIQSFDWSATALGDRNNWPAELQFSFKILLATATPSVILWGSDRIFLYNDALSLLLGSSHPFSLGKPIESLFPDVNIDTSADPQSDQHSEFKLALSPPHSSCDATLSFKLTAIPDSTGQTAGYLGFIDENGQLAQPSASPPMPVEASVLENLTEAIALADLSGNVYYHNPSSLRLHGYQTIEDAKLPKTHYAHLWEVRDLDGKNIPVDQWPMSRALRDEDFTNYELSIHRKDNQAQFIGSFSGKLVRDRNGTPRFAMLSIRDISDRKQAELALKNQSELLQTIYDRIPVMLAIFDPQLQEIVLNKHVERVTGWNESDLKKHSIMDLVYPDPAYRKMAEDYMASLQPGFKDLFMAVKGGGFVETSWANVQITDGRQVGIGVNISERVKTERLLKAYSNRLESLHKIDEAILAAKSKYEIAHAVLQYIPELLPRCEAANITLFTPENNAIQLLASTTVHEYAEDTAWPVPEGSVWQGLFNRIVQGQTFVLDDLDDFDTTSLPFFPILQPGVSINTVHPLKASDRIMGTLNLAFRDSTQLSEEQSEIIRELLVPLTIGIEQSQLHEKTLQINRRLLETVINNIPVAVALISGPNQRVLYANPTYYRITPEKRLVGKTLDEIWGPFEFNYSDLCRKVLETGKPYFVEDDEVVLPTTAEGNGATSYFSWWLFPINIPDEDEMGILNMAYETTDRKMAEMALIEAERLTTIGRMASSLAHEINNPIQSVVGCLGLAMELQEEGKDATKFMHVAMEELIRTSQIVQRLRDLARRNEVEKEPTDLDEIIEKVVTLTQKKAHNAQVAVNRIRDGKLPAINVVADQIRQVILNLILNAIEAMPDGGELTITSQTSPDKKRIEIAITDTGIGISESEKRRLFSAHHTTKQLGLGLGLFISRRIILNHNGTISVESEPGKGSTFTLSLPTDLS